MKTKTFAAIALTGLTLALAETAIKTPPLPPASARPKAAKLVAPPSPATNVTLTLTLVYDGVMSDDVEFRYYSTDSVTVTDSVTNAVWIMLAQTNSLNLDIDAVPGTRFYMATAVSKFWGTEAPRSPIFETPEGVVGPKSIDMRRK